MEPIIDIILDGKLFTSRNIWKITPRVGEIILLKNGTVFAEVKQIVIGNDSANKNRQWIQLACETLSKSIAHYSQMKHIGECSKDAVAKQVCEDMYGDKCSDVLKLQEALRAVLILVGENKEINKICTDAIKETGGE